MFSRQTLRVLVKSSSRRPSSLTAKSATPSGLLLALGDELIGPDEDLALAAGRIVTDDVSALSSLAGLQRQVGRAVLEPVDRPELLFVELVRSRRSARR